MNKIVFDSPIGKIAAFSENKKIIRIILKTNEKADETSADDILFEAKKQILEYFEGKRICFDLKCELRGTDFQKAVWRELEKIPFGETKTYGEIAFALEKTKGARAVGMACNKNPLAIIYPCHRVVGKNGKLTGFACGTEIKEWLLNHEARLKGEYNET